MKGKSSQDPEPTEDISAVLLSLRNSFCDSCILDISPPTQQPMMGVLEKRCKKKCKAAACLILTGQEIVGHIYAAAQYSCYYCSLEEKCILELPLHQNHVQAI